MALAWRNLWRHRRRSLITATAMAVGVGLCMTMICMSDGMYRKMFEVMVEQSLGHVQIHDPDYPSKRSMYETLHDAQATLTTLDGLPGVRAVSPRLIGYALIGGAGDKSTGGQLIGVDPAREAANSPIPDRLTAGAWLGPDRAAEAVLGVDLAKDLGVGVGDAVVVVTQASDGSLGNAVYTVKGLVRSGSTAIDKGGVFLHLADLQELLVLPDQVHELTVLGDDAGGIEALKAEVQGSMGDGRLVRTWWEVAPQVQQLLGMQNFGSALMLGIVLTVAGFGVVNTMLMSVFERTRELGVLLAIGLRPAQLVGMVVLESLMLAAVSVSIGLTLGALGDAYMVLHGLDFSASAGEGFSFSGVTLDPVIRGHVRPGPILACVVGVFTISALAALWPALRAARLQPVQAIRSE